MVNDAGCFAKFSFTLGSGLLLVTSGFCGHSGDACPTEVIDFYTQTKTNTSNCLPNYPENNYGTTGSMVGNHTYVSCGGKGHDGQYSKNCYKFGSTTPFATMPKRRMYGASVVINKILLWVTGGQDVNLNHRTTDLIDPVTERMEYGPYLPMDSVAHCLVLINSTTAMLIGGLPDSRDKTWMYNFEMEHQGWVAGPDLNTVSLYSDNIVAIIYIVTIYAVDIVYIVTI